MKCNECMKYVTEHGQCEVTCEKVNGNQDCELERMAERLWKIKN